MRIDTKGKPRGWLAQQVIAVANRGVTRAELVDYWGKRGVTRQAIGKILVRNQHPLACDTGVEWFPTFSGFCPVDCGHFVSVTESQYIRDGWFDLRRKLRAHVEKSHPEVHAGPMMDWWDLAGNWERVEAPIVQERVEAVRAEAKQGAQAQEVDPLEAANDVARDEDDRRGGLELAMLRMLCGSGAIDP